MKKQLIFALSFILLFSLGLVQAGTVSEFQPCNQQEQCISRQGSDSFYCVNINNQGFKWYEAKTLWQGDPLRGTGKCGNFKACSTFVLASSCAGVQEVIRGEKFPEVYSLEKFSGFCNPETKAWNFNFEASFNALCVQKTTSSPKFSAIPDQVLLQNSGFNNNIIDLHNFVSDLDTPTSNLKINVITESNPEIVVCNIDNNRFLDCFVKQGISGESFVTMHASDGIGLDRATVKIKVLPKTDQPVCRLTWDNPTQSGKALRSVGDNSNVLIQVLNLEKDSSFIIKNTNLIDPKILIQQALKADSQGNFMIKDSTIIPSDYTNGEYKTEILGMNSQLITPCNPGFIIVEKTVVSNPICELTWDDPKTQDGRALRSVGDKSNVLIKVSNLEKNSEYALRNTNLNNPRVKFQVVFKSDEQGSYLLRDSTVIPQDYTPGTYVVQVLKGLNNEIQCNPGFIIKGDIAPVCGNGIKETGEQCDGSSGVGNNQQCTSQCTLINLPFCGDGIKNGNEQCDKSSGIAPGQICTLDCRIETIKESLPPKFKQIPAQQLKKDSGFNNDILDLHNFVTDPDTPLNNLKFFFISKEGEIIPSLDSDFIECTIDTNRFIDCSVKSGKTGETAAILRVTDSFGFDTTTFVIVVVEKIPEENKPPVIQNLPDKTLLRNSGLNDNIIDLHQFTSDPDTLFKQLTFTIISETNTNIADCSLDNNRFVDCFAKNNLGFTDVTIEVSDGKASSSDTFRVTVADSLDQGKVKPKTKKVSIESLFGYNEIYSLAVYGKVKNTGTVKSHITARLTIPGLNYYDVKNFDLGSKQAKWVIFMPDIPKGKYVAQLYVDNGKDSEIKYVEIERK